MIQYPQMDRTRLPDCTLRNHTVAVTQLLVVANSFDAENIENDLIPKLISTDEMGKIIVWNLLTRRPMVDTSIPTGASITAIQLLASKYLVCLSKDYTLRILDWNNLIEKPLFEMNVNTMNFANFTISIDKDEKNFVLCCCNTQDAEAIDIYQINIKTSKLTRLFNHIDFHSIIKDNLILSLDKKVPDKLGMIMKFEQDLRSNTIFIGFESGIIIGFQIDSEMLKIIYLSTSHFPEPVLDIQVVGGLKDVTGTLISSSTNNIIIKHTYPISETITNRIKMNNIFKSSDLTPSTPQTIEVKGTKIAHIAEFENHLIWATWNGKLFIKDTYSGVIHKYKRSKGNIRPNESSQGSISKNQYENKEPRYVKLGAMAIFKSTSLSAVKDIKSLVVMNRSSQRRLDQFISHSWSFVGYNDGTISLYQIE